MKTMTVKASAKINLLLDVVGKRNDGYHYIKSVFQSVGIFDIVTVTETSKGIRITADKPGIPCDMTNIAYKAALLFMEYTGIECGVDIHIEKNIPSQAGLGGGSSDGAAVLFAMNEMFGTRMTISELAEIGGRISADTAFFIFGGTAFVEGIGEIINPIRSLAPFHLVIAKGKAGISTPEAYSRIDTLETIEHPKMGKLLKAIDKGNFLKKCELCENVFELVTETKDVFDLKNHLEGAGAKKALMSGSGSAVFGIFEHKKDADKCVEELRKYYYYAEYCEAVSQSLMIV